MSPVPFWRGPIYMLEGSVLYGERGKPKTGGRWGFHNPASGRTQLCVGPTCLRYACREGHLLVWLPSCLTHYHATCRELCNPNGNVNKHVKLAPSQDSVVIQNKLPIMILATPPEQPGEKKGYPAEIRVFPTESCTVLQKMRSLAERCTFV